MTIYDAYRVLLEALRREPATVARERAIEKLEESAFWASASLAGQPSPIEYVSGTKSKGVQESDKKPAGPSS